MQVILSKDSNMLSRWLACSNRDPCPYSQFEVIDVSPINEISKDTHSHLTKLLSNELFDPSYLAEMSKYLGWKTVSHNIISTKIPKTGKIKKGTFGEMLINAILEEFYNYYVPVRKLRYLIKSDISPPGIDSVAFKVNEHGQIEEVCFIESKLRASDHFKNKDAGVDGYNQLKINYESRSLDILNFIAERLYERNDPFFGPFACYMRERDNDEDIDTFRLSLCWDSYFWDESVLANLDDKEIDIPKFNIHVILIAKLKSIIEDVFIGLGVDAGVSEDDD
jgi:hypothetical protein